jgi:uncharacterized protein (TIGR02145 family)
MNLKNKSWFLKILMTVIILFLIGSCQKVETSSKNDPVITWENPSDIPYGTLLSATQLNAMSDLPGTFFYTPAAGTKLNEGANQDLKADFTPTDQSTYNTASKTVKINVISGGVSSAVFNPDLTYGTVTDIENNVYKTITIGTQTWMAENLRTTKYRNGEAIPEVTGSTEWKNLKTAAYCNYENTTDKDKIATFGRLYNWYVVTDSRNIAPAGWHVATDAEWTALTTYLGNESLSGGKLKETGTSHWKSPNTGASNGSGFTALPGGRREYDTGAFINLGYDGFWWTSSAYNPDYSWYRYLHYDVANIYRANFHKQYGFMVRCIRDQ